MASIDNRVDLLSKLGSEVERREAEIAEKNKDLEADFDRRYLDRQKTEEGGVKEQSVDDDEVLVGDGEGDDQYDEQDEILRKSNQEFAQEINMRNQTGSDDFEDSVEVGEGKLESKLDTQQSLDRLSGSNGPSNSSVLDEIAYATHIGLGAALETNGTKKSVEIRSPSNNIESNKQNASVMNKVLGSRHSKLLKGHLGRSFQTKNIGQITAKDPRIFRQTAYVNSLSLSKRLE